MFLIEAYKLLKVFTLFLHYNLQFENNDGEGISEQKLLNLIIDVFALGSAVILLNFIIKC